MTNHKNILCVVRIFMKQMLDLRKLQEQVKKEFCYQKLIWPFSVWINCSCDYKNFADSRPLASNFKSFSRSLEQFFLTVDHYNFGNKIPFKPYFPFLCIHAIKLLLSFSRAFVCDHNGSKGFQLIAKALQRYLGLLPTYLLTYVWQLK